MQQHDQWIWYLLGAIMTLAWKWQRYCYESKGTGIPFWKASRCWWEMQTVGSQISWGVSIGIVWVIGAVVINRIAIGWFFDGFFMNVPAKPPFLFLVGALAELAIPWAAKWICSKIPYASFDDLRPGESMKPGE